MFVPENELGVIVAFAQEAHHYGFQIQTISSAFPDATIEKDGVLYRAEFEFDASAFDVHGHDHRECDLIICWNNDCPDTTLPVLALSEDDWMNTDLTLPGDNERAAYYWRRRAVRAERALKLLKNQTANNLEPGMFQCDICGRSFKSQRALSGHGNAHRTDNGRKEPQREHHRA